jgi:folate-binding protein YgfZ
VPRSSPSSAGESPADWPADYAAARTGFAHRWRTGSTLAIEGPDRVAFLQGQLTQDVRGLGPGECREVAGLTPKGKLLYFGRMVGETDRILLLVPSGACAAVVAHLSKYAVFQKVAVRDASNDYVRLGLYGPRASGFDLPSGAVRLPGDGEFAGEVLAAAAARASLERALAEARSVEVSLDSAEALRIEAGRPRLGQDADATNLADEVGLQGAISTTKGCYVGQEIVARLRTYGRVNRRLVGFRFSTEGLAAGTVFPDPAKRDHELARVTSAAVSPRFGPIGLGFAFRDVTEGASLSRAEDPERTAIVSRIPFE